MSKFTFHSFLVLFMIDFVIMFSTFIGNFLDYYNIDVYQLTRHVLLGKKQQQKAVIQARQLKNGSLVFFFVSAAFK